MIPKSLVAASLRPLILSILRRGPSYGYAIMDRVHELSSGEMTWTDGHRRLAPCSSSAGV